MWQGIIVGGIICIAIVYLFRRYFRSMRSKDPCCGCSSCGDSPQKNTCGGIDDMRSTDAEANPQGDAQKPTKE